MRKILVTPRSVTRNGHPALERLTEAGYELVFSKPGCFPTEEELLGLLPGCVGYLAGVENITASVLDAAGDLKVISRNGTGTDTIDLAAAERNGITVCRAAGANARGVAELTFGLILALVRSLPFTDRAMKNEGWERRKGIELEGKTLGIVGCGTIGRSVAGFAVAFGMNVVAHDPFPDTAFKPADGSASGDFSYGSMETLLERAQIISLHCPPTPEGKPLVDAALIAKMRDNVYLLNTARGNLLERGAVLEALESGKLAGVAVDAFVQEPPEDWSLVKHSRVIATPHIGGFTTESIHRAMSVAVQNLIDTLAESGA